MEEKKSSPQSGYLRRLTSLKWNLADKANGERNIKVANLFMQKLAPLIHDKKLPEPGFIGALARITSEAVAEAKKLSGETPAIIFSAHGLPKKIVDQGDPYVAQVAATPNEQLAMAELSRTIKGGLGGKIEGLTAQDANTRVNIALQRALTRSHSLLGTHTPAGMILGDIAARSTGHGSAEIPAALAGGLLGHALTSPAGMATTSLALTDPATQILLRNAPRGLMEYLQAAQSNGGTR